MTKSLSRREEGARRADGRGGGAGRNARRRARPLPAAPQVDQSTLFELILAANYLNIKPLLDLTCGRVEAWGARRETSAPRAPTPPPLPPSCLTVANMIKGKTPEEIRKTFNIPNDFTPEEEEEVRRENQWAFE